VVQKITGQPIQRNLLPVAQLRKAGGQGGTVTSFDSAYEESSTDLFARTKVPYTNLDLDLDEHMAPQQCYD